MKWLSKDQTLMTRSLAHDRASTQGTPPPLEAGLQSSAANFSGSRIRWERGRTDFGNQNCCSPPRVGIWCIFNLLSGIHMSQIFIQLEIVRRIVATVVRCSSALGRNDIPTYFNLYFNSARGGTTIRNPTCQKVDIHTKLRDTEAG